MSLINFILNVAGLLLWLNWRSNHADPFMRRTPATLSGTLRRAQPVKVKRWHYLVALGALLFVRAIFYWQVGPAVNWIPRLDLFFVVLTFHIHEPFFLPPLPLLFSLLSFLRDFLGFYFWLLVLETINRRESGSDPIQKMISLQLGRLARWPVALKILSPVFVVAALWLLFHPVMVYTGVTNPTKTIIPLLEQSLLLGAGLFLSLKHLLPGLLAVHLIASYVYLGKNPLWDFAGMTGKNLLAPLDRFSLRAGKVDLAPMVGIILILLPLYVLPNILLPWLINRYNLTLWPQ